MAVCITSNCIEADYLVETAFDPRHAADVMACEQSSGTFVAVPGETPELKARADARVLSVEVTDEVTQPSLPGAARPDGAPIWPVRVTLSWPLANLGPSLPKLMATVAGNLFDLRQFSGLRLETIRLPREFARRYPGPRFGIDGTRRVTGVHVRSLIGTIVKPSVGAGVDFIMDDELQSDGPACPFEARVRAIMPVLERHADCTGRKAMVAFNLTGEIDEMRARHDVVRDLGGTCVMASLNSFGLVGMVELGRFATLPVIHAHLNWWGYLSRAPMLGWSFPAWQVIWRLVGANHLHVDCLCSKFSEADDSVVASARACLTPLWDDASCLAMSVFSSGQTSDQASDTWQHLGSVDLTYAAGGGILGHPDGPAAGVAALRDAWDAAMEPPPRDAVTRR